MYDGCTCVCICVSVCVQACMLRSVSLGTAHAEVREQLCEVIFSFPLTWVPAINEHHQT